MPIGITPEGRWLVGGDPLQALLSGERTSRATGLDAAPTWRQRAWCRSETMAKSRVEPYDRSANRRHPWATLDVLFPVLHGTYGEDGTVQGLFDLAAVPYAGAGVLGSALGMDKVVQKTLWRGLGLPVADFVSVLRARASSATPRRVLDAIERDARLPVLRQARESRLQRWRLARRATARSCGQASQTAARYDAKLIVERGIDARELEVRRARQRRAAGLGRRRDPARRRVLRLSRQVPRQRLAGVIPGRHPARARRRGPSAWRWPRSKPSTAAGLARVDFFLERGTGRLYLNEINTMPGFTEISMYPKLWEASGVPFAELVTRIAELGLERFEERARNQHRLRRRASEGPARGRRLGRLGHAGAGGGTGAAAARAIGRVAVRRHAGRARGGTRGGAGHPVRRRHDRASSDATGTCTT